MGKVVCRSDEECRILGLIAIDWTGKLFPSEIKDYSFHYSAGQFGSSFIVSVSHPSAI